MKWLDRLILRAYQRAHYDDCHVPEDVPQPRTGWGRKGNSTLGSGGSNGPSVQANYDDAGVISFKVYGANGGMIVETSRYNAKRDDSYCISRYVIDESKDFAESLSHIVTMEYLR